MGDADVVVVVVCERVVAAAVVVALAVEAVNTVEVVVHVEG